MNNWWNAEPGELYGDNVNNEPCCDHCGEYRVAEKGQICGACTLTGIEVPDESKI